MRNRFIYFFVICVVGCLPELQAGVRKTHKADTLSAYAKVAARYMSALDESVRRYDSLKNVAIEENFLTPYHFRMFAPPTLYQAPLRQTMDIPWTPFAQAESDGRLLGDVQADSVLMWNEYFNVRLMDVYTHCPQLITTTEQELSRVDNIREELIQPIQHKVKLAEKTVDVDLGADVDVVDVVVKKPNFWKFSGNGSVQFSQSYFSDNWYKGGEDNYTMLGLLTLELKYDNKQRVQWENKLEMKLGFQTMKSDEEHKLKTNEDLLRLTSKLGYKASKHWFYTTEVQASTQFYPSYQSNSTKVQSDFMSPFYLSISVGMDYKLDLKRFNLSAYLAPVAYKFAYVDRSDLASRFGMQPFHVTKIDFGPNITLNYKWKICNNIQWDSRAYWFSNLKLTTIEWENTFTFTINKYLSSKLFLYPRLDDSSKKYWSEDMEGYFMFREWFSLGLNYSF